MLLNKIIQRDYTSFSLYYQIKLPLDLEISIPSDDPVRLVSAFVEEMDLSELYKTYGRIRKNQATPRQMLKLVIYAAMNRIYSSRDIRKACKRDINFMYLLEGVPAPDHATIARFISLHFSACAKALLAQMSDLLYLLGEISGKTIFIDGTKIESAANKYTFVWKKAITKNQVRLYTKLSFLYFRVLEIVADAGYESEENYLFIEGNGQTAYIKPQNYEISKLESTKKTSVEGKTWSITQTVTATSAATEGN